MPSLRTSLAALTITIVLVSATSGQSQNCDVAAEPSPAALEQGFTAPPMESRTWSIWWWLNSYVTKAAITRDLEEMKKQGWGGGYIYNSSGAEGSVPKGPYFGSPEWNELFAHALQEADRLGLTLSLLIQDGYDIGGPCVKVEEAAKRVVWSEITLTGGKKVDALAPVPQHNLDFYRDIAVVGYPAKTNTKTSEGEITCKISASSSEKPYPPSLAADGGSTTFWVAEKGPAEDRPEWLQIDLSEPASVTGLSLMERSGYGPRQCELQYSLNKGPFQKIKRFTAEGSQPMRIDFESVRADAFRLVIYSANNPTTVQIAEVTLHGVKQDWPPCARKPIRDFVYKIAGEEYGWTCVETSPLLFDDPEQPGEEDCRVQDVVDLTKFMDAEGRLRWDAPEGQWHILRFGYTPTGAKVHIPHPKGGGLVIDYLDAEAFRSYWRQVMEPILANAAPWLGRSLKYLMIDSYEAGGQNWTKNFRDEFLKRRGYDVVPYLPVLAGRIVDNRPITTRFLNDFRKTIGDCMTEYHYEVFAELAHRHKLGIHPKGGGPHGLTADALKNLGRNDFTMVEFWAQAKAHRVTDEARFCVKEGASAAHIYGIKIAASEAFTSMGPRWDESFGENLKPTFDFAACEGVQRLLWHTITCSPPELGLPGIEYFAGTHCNPNVTWWRLSRGFIEYLNRCQYLLQQGMFVADACYYYGDQVPNFAQIKSSDPAQVLPHYDYDVLNEEVLLNRLSVRDGRLVLPDGMSYHAMALPKHQFCSVAAMKKIAQLVEDGATVVGPKPMFVTGLTDYPACDAELKRLADEVWGPCDGQTVTEHPYGKGKVVWGPGTSQILVAKGVLPDFEWQTNPQNAPLHYIHRKAGDAHVYYVCNFSDRPGAYQCTFRVADMAPELWAPDTGTMQKTLVYDFTKDNRTTLPLYFDAYGSVFVVFHSKPARRFTACSKDGQPIFPRSAESPNGPLPEVVADNDHGFVLKARLPGNYELTDPQGKVQTISVPAVKRKTIEGPWTVQFPEGWGAPASVVFDTLESWTESDNPNIKYFSGEATYVREIDVPAEFLGPDRSLELDLGNVEEMAEVVLNGQSLGVVWKAPFRVDITNVARPGANQLEIHVANHWRNRLIGDAKLPPEKRFTKTNITTYKDGDDSLLLPSGVLGPVTLQSLPLALQPPGKK